MRNPIERTISIYNYIKKRSGHKDHDLANKLIIEEFIKRGHNYLSILFYQDPLECYQI